MPQPLVTIGVPVYNGGRLLAGALDSLLAQTFEDYEILILDNASTDNTKEIALQYAHRDPRIRYERNETNIGSTPNYNLVARKAIGKYFRWQACDDLVLPTYLEKTVPLLENNPDAILAFTHAVMMGDNNEILPFNEEKQAYVLSNGALWNYDKNAENDLIDPDPTVRFRALMWSTIASTVTYGLFRTTKLQQTQLIGLHGNERLMLAELALKAPFQRVDEILFHRYVDSEATHSESRRKIFEYQTGRKQPFIMPPWRSALNYLGTVHRAPLAFNQKLRCWATIASFSLRLNSLKNMLIPGHDNYFGIDFSSRPTSKEASHA